MLKSLFSCFVIICASGNVVLAQQPLTDSLIAYYPFNGNAKDSSGHGNNGTVYGATLTADRFGNPNSAYYFDGINDSIGLFAADSAFRPTTFPVTVCAWIKSNTFDEFGVIFKNDYKPDIYSGIAFGVQIQHGGVLEIRYGDGGTTKECCRRSKFGTTNVNDNQWHFVAGIIRGKLDMDIYVDCHNDHGDLDGDGGHIYYADSSGGSVGKIDVVAGLNYFKGAIDDVRFYHRELTQQDLQLLHDTPQPYESYGDSISLGNDTSICSGTSMVLNPVTNGTVYSYLWSDGSTDSVLQVSAFGTYWVHAIEACGYSTDSIDISINSIEPVNLGADTLLCQGQFLILDAGAGYDAYLWSNGAFTQTQAVFTSGTYWVTASTPPCSTSDSINVDFEVCTGADQLSLHGLNLYYDAGAHSINMMLTGNSLPAAGRLILYNAVGAQLMNRQVDFKQGTESIFLQEPLIPGVYMACVQVGDSIISKPLLVVQ